MPDPLQSARRRIERHVASVNSKLRFSAQVLARRFGGVLDANDILQQAYLSAWTHAEKFRGDSPEELERWLRPFLRYSALNLRRSPRYVSPASPMGGADEAELLDPYAATPLDLLAQREEHSSVGFAVNGLAESDRRAIRSFYFCGLTTPQIASISQSRPGVVQKQLQRVRRDLRRSLRHIEIDARTDS